MWDLAPENRTWNVSPGSALITGAGPRLVGFGPRPSWEVSKQAGMSGFL